jgi:hypothetical protein
MSVGVAGPAAELGTVLGAVWYKSPVPTSPSVELIRINPLVWKCARSNAASRVL